MKLARDPMVLLRSGDAPGARFFSGHVVLDEAFLGGRLCTRYWSTAGQVVPEMYAGKTAWAVDEPADAFGVSVNNQDLAGGFAWIDAREEKDPSGLRAAGPGVACAATRLAHKASGTGGDGPHPARRRPVRRPMARNYQPVAARGGDHPRVSLRRDGVGAADRRALAPRPGNRAAESLRTGVQPQVRMGPGGRFLVRAAGGWREDRERGEAREERLGPSRVLGARHHQRPDPRLRARLERQLRVLPRLPGPARREGRETLLPHRALGAVRGAAGPAARRDGEDPRRARGILPGRRRRDRAGYARARSHRS